MKRESPPQTITSKDLTPEVFSMQSIRTYAACRGGVAEAAQAVVTAHIPRGSPSSRPRQPGRRGIAAAPVGDLLISNSIVIMYM